MTKLCSRMKWLAGLWVVIQAMSLSHVAADQRDEALGAWRGYLEHQRTDGKLQKVYLRLNVTEEDGAKKASISAYQIGLQASAVLRDDGTHDVEFEFSLGGEQARLSADIEGEKLSGTLSTDGSSRTIELVRVDPDVDQTTPLFRGQLVEFDDGEKMVLAPSQWTLNAFEMNARRHHVYFPTSNKSFVAGAASLVPAPVEMKLTVEETREGLEIILQRDGKPKVGRFSNAIVQEEIEFANGETVLKGLLVRPIGKENVPGIVVVWGSGRQDRFGFSGLPYFRAVWFALQGYAAVVYDKRGVGESGGSYDDRTFDELALDMVAAVDYLAKRPEVDSDDIGILVHSQSGIYAPIALAASDRIKYAAVIATTVVNAEIQEIVRTRQQLEADGWPQHDVIDAEATQILKFYYAMNRIGWEAYLQAYERIKDKPWFGPIVGSPNEKTASAWDFWKNTNGFEPSEGWAQIERPLFFLYGDRDPINPVEQNLELLKQAFAGDRVRFLTTKLYENADHSLFMASEGGLMEESVISAYHPYMEDILAWIEGID